MAVRRVKIDDNDSSSRGSRNFGNRSQSGRKQTCERCGEPTYNYQFINPDNFEPLDHKTGKCFCDSCVIRMKNMAKDARSGNRQFERDMAETMKNSMDDRKW